MVRLKHAFVLVGAVLFLTACKGGGNLTLEPGVKKVTSKGSPFVTVNQGGKALIWDATKTAETGVHGFVTVQAVTSGQLASPSGTQVILNKTQAVH